jgi:SAM-dependent methyltransferase
VGSLRKSSSFQPGLLQFITSPVFIARRGLFKSIRKLAPQLKGEVLDFGCGSKPYENLFSNASRYIGCDIELSGHNHENSKIDCFYDGQRLPFLDASFDAAVSFETFEHVFNLPEILDEIRRVVKPSGLLLVSVPFAWDEHEQPYDYARYTSFGMKHLLTDHGFDVLQAEKTTTYLLATFQMLIAYVYQYVLPRNRVIGRPLQMMIIFPLTCLAYALNAIAPKNYNYFTNLVVVARKRGT